jgi:PadR family transcriptional regulator, regulatory protein PadR
MSELIFSRDPAFLILAALARGDLHGYGIMKEVESLSGGQVRLALGTLYGALDRLVGNGMVEISREERTGGRLRRYYHLTDAGVDPFSEETELQSRLVEVARKNLESRRAVIAKPLEAL